jgi:hypothetical protein
MGRVKPLWRVQKQLEYAQKRETYLKRTDRPVKATVDKRIKTLVGYRSSLVNLTAGTALIQLQVSQSALKKFGDEAALGLVAAANGIVADAIKEPKGFKPAQLHGLVGASTGIVKTAAGSGRRYIKYGANATGEAQSSFTCAVSSGSATATPETQAAKAKTVANAVKTAFNADSNGYGRLWFTAEEYTEPLV